MSDCGVCIGTNDYDPVEFYHSEMRKARKRFLCCECRQEIQPGTQYEKAIMRFDGDFLSYRTCALCVEIRTKFCCNGGGLFATLWDEMREYAFPELTTGCFDGLSAAAKQFLMDRWNIWKFGRAT